MSSSSPSTPTSEKPGNNNAGILGGAASSRFASSSSSSSPSSHSHSIPIQHSYSNTSSTHSRPSSPSTTRTSSPSFNRRSNSSSSATIGGVGVGSPSSSSSNSVHNPLRYSNNHSSSVASYSSPTTPQRQHSGSGGGIRRALTPSSSSSVHSPANPTTGSPSSSRNPEAALTSLQELIRTMPSASSESGHNSPNARSSPVTATTGSTSSLPRLRSTSSTAGTGSNVNMNTASASSSTTTTTSTLNPNAGGFQPGALSALGEVEHEVLITPQVATFGPGISSPIVQGGGGNGRHPQSPMHGQSSQGQAGAGGNGGALQHAGGPFSPATAAGNNNTTGGISNVFGSPIQTPSSQANHNHANHNPYMNTPEWQNFHNVFNAGIGNNNNTNTAGSPPPTSHASNVAGGAGVLNNGNNMSPMSPSNNGIDFNSILASMQGGNNNSMGQFMDFNALGGAGVGGGMNAAQAALAAAMAGGGNGGNMNPMNNPFQAQLAMLQQMQQASNNNNSSNNQGYNGGNNANAQQAALLQQAQQMQLALMLQAQQQQQAQAQAQVSVQNQGIAPRFNNNASAASNSQPDLASIAAGLSTAGNNSNVGGGAPFMAEQMALQAQYEALRLQQQELMNRFQEMQIQAVQLAQAQAQMGSPQQQQQQQQQVHVQQSHSPAHSHHGSTTTTTGNHGIGSPLGAAQAQAQLNHHHSRDASIQQQQQNNQGGPPVSGTGRQPHRRGASQSISGMASSGPMGQFGSMGQFALPSQASSGTNTAAAGGGVGLPKGHGRRHSVNVNAAKRNENNNNNNIMAFSFPAGAANPTQGGTTAGGGGAQVADQLGAINATAGHEQQEEVPGQQRAARAYGHGRRESRGSIGSLAGWGSNSNVVTQSSVPITQPTVTDLAQAQSQLLQLSQFRASAGHSRIPSFGIQQLQGGPGGNQQRKSLFAPYLPAASIPPLLQTGKLVIGVLRVNKRNRSDAYVATDVLDADVFICGSKDRNRALEGDVVAVELLDVDEVWGTKKEKEEKKRKKEESTSFDPKFQQALRKQDKKRDDVEVEGQGLTLFDDEEVNDDSKPTYAGHVIAVVERQAGQLFAGTLGILRPSSAATKEKQDAERRERDGIDIRGGDEQRNRPKIVWFKPVDKRVPLVAIPADQAPSGFLDRPDDYVNTLFVACIKRWPITSLHPFGSLVEELGEIGNLEAESNALLKDCGFTDETFSDNVAKCLPPTPWNIPQTEIDARKDFRQCRVFTIDPDTARDLDDALHINKLDDGTFEVGVHIADVSHFVKPNTALDREARRRGTTVYLVQRASPMLPESLSSDLCSLQPGEDRLAFSSVFKMSADGRVLSSWFGKSVIKSAAKLSYNMAQQAIDEGKLPENLTIHDDHDMEGIVNDIKQLDNMAKQMRARRFENGALRIDNVKLSFALDDEGRPIDCVVYERKDSHSLIEEFMLTANQAVAQKIASALPEQALLRRHEMPIARRLEGFTKRAGKLGYDFDITSAGSLMKSFKSLSKEDPELVLRLLATKAMLKASYICSGMFDIAKYHHYALNIPIYTHFTSPIRRYADVIVHRQLEAALTENPEGRFLMDPEAVSKVAQHCNTKKSAAKLAQEASQHLYLCTMVSDLTQKYGPVMRQATVIGVLDQAFDVVVSDFGIEKRVHADQMPIENHVYDERSNTLQLYWKKGVDVIKFLAENSGDPHLQRVKETAEQHARLMESSTQHTQAESALFDDDEEEGQVPEVAPTTSKSTQQLKSSKRSAPIFEAIEETSAGHCVQTIKELQTIPVIISSDLTVSPPVIKCFAVNPFN